MSDRTTDTDWRQAYISIAQSPFIVRVRTLGASYQSVINPRVALGQVLKAELPIGTKRRRVAAAIAHLINSLDQLSSGPTHDESAWLHQWNTDHTLGLKLDFIPEPATEIQGSLLA